MRAIIRSFEVEHNRYKTTADKAIREVRDSELRTRSAPEANSVAIISWHVSANLSSKFTEFLTTDGDKSWRDRDSEFEDRDVSRAELLEQWERGWAILFKTLSELNDEHLLQKIRVGGKPYSVHEALCRSLMHTSYHIGQIVLMARQFRGEAWQILSIPRKRKN